MKAIFYYNTSEAIKVDKDLEYIAELDIVFKTSVSLKNPIIDLELKFQDNNTLVDVVDEDNQDVVFGLDNDSMVVDYPFSITDFNYCYIPVLERYYYVNNPILVTDRLFRLELSEDVLMSLKSQYKELDAFIARNEFDYNVLIKDDLTNFQYNKSINVFKWDRYLYSTIWNITHFGTLVVDPHNIMMSYLTEDVTQNISPINSSPVNYINMPFNKMSTNYCVMNMDTAKRLSKKFLEDDTLLTFIKNMRIYPYIINNNQDYSKLTMKIGSTSLSVPTYFSGDRYRDPTAVIDNIVVASFMIPKAAYNNFLYYSPYTKFELYLPYYRWVEFEADDLIGQLILVEYSTNYDSGETVLTVYNKTKENILLEVTIELGMEIPLSSTNNREQTDKNISLGLNTAISLLGSGAAVVTGNPLGFVTGAKTISDAIMGFNTNYSKGNVETGNGLIGNYGYNDVMIRVTRNIPSGYDADYFKMKGRPLYETRKISTLSGFTQIGDIHLENIKAYQNEKDELYDLLKSGIIL